MMRKRFHRSIDLRGCSTWREYQDRHRCGRKMPFWRRSKLPLVVILGLILVGIFNLDGIFKESPAVNRQGTAQASVPAATPKLHENRLFANLTAKQAVRQLLDLRTVSDLSGKSFRLPLERQVLQVETSLDEDLQNYLLDKMDRKNSRYIGIVVMEADTGRVLAMAGFDRNDPNGNPCLRSEFPAASIFKIVTAASAVDACGLTADSKLRFNGYKHTLYKRQLKDRVNRYTNTVSFKDAFAQSINPVFGKIGQSRLGKPQLVKSAEAFGFNEPLDFELPIDVSQFSITDKPYNWAEIASGFNQDTTISPLHGALMATAVLNQGNMVTPSLVDQIVDAEGNVIYSRQPASKHAAMSAKASEVLSRLMENTVSSGTGRKAFRGYRRDKVLSRLDIGGKTGSIDNHSHDVRFDWFVGFAREKEGQKKLAVAVMVAHQDYIGIRAGQYARMAFSHYFKNHSSADSAPKVAGKKDGVGKNG
jgi:peptidoglycan glycosyltransferase